MKRVLLIDDEASFTTGVKVNLEDTGDYEVAVVNDSALAHATALEFRPDIVLLDIVMPGLDGGDIVKQLEADPELAAIPVLAVTAMLHKESAGTGMIETGDISMLAKPVKTATLIECIEIKLARVAGQSNEN